MIFFIPCFNMQYVQSVRTEKIPDHTAIIYHTVYQAYTADGEFRNTDKANLYFGQYKNRVARAGQFKNDGVTVRTRGKFF